MTSVEGRVSLSLWYTTLRDGRDAGILSRYWITYYLVYFGVAIGLALAHRDNWHRRTACIPEARL